MEKEAEGSYNILQGLPNHVLAYVLFFLDKDSKHVSVLNVLSKSFVVGDPVWNALFHIRFGNDMMKWPVFTSWKGYYNFLHRWVPWEGFYVLEDARPWGLLFLFRFVDRKFVGDVLWTDGRNALETTNPLFAPIRVVEIAFAGDENDKKDDHCDRKDSRVVTVFGKRVHDLVTTRSPISVEPEERILQHFPFASMGPSRIESGRIELRLAPLSSSAPSPLSSLIHNLPEHFRSARASQHSDIAEAWIPDVPRDLASSSTRRLADEDDDEGVLTSCDDEEENVGSIRSMLQTLIEARISASVRTLNFRWVDGPERVSRDFFEYHVPLIRPGLYYGTYNRMYHKFKREVLLVQYKRYKIHPTNASETWESIRKEMFCSDIQQDPQGAFDRVRRQLDSAREIVFVTGRKCTGDIHVPSGELTWVALVHPAMPIEASEEVDYVSEREVPSLRYHVRRSFFGWGTLAHPGFRRPCWNIGLLVQIDAEGLDHRPIIRGGRSARERHAFGFLWGRSGRSDVVVLRWLRIQEECPFFGRR
eukprot:g4664.t1